MRRRWRRRRRRRRRRRMRRRRRIRSNDDDQVDMTGSQPYARVYSKPQHMALYTMPEAIYTIFPWSVYQHILYSTIHTLPIPDTGRRQAAVRGTQEGPRAKRVACFYSDKTRTCRHAMQHAGLHSRFFLVQRTRGSADLAAKNGG
jgi:hypothetical protein